MSSLERTVGLQKQEGAESAKSSQSRYLGSWVEPATLTPLFATIPPERVGLDGEYDHSGLAKRVALAFKHRFEFSAVEQLYVAQRGRVVILQGRVPSQALLAEMVQVALGVSGATDVEIYGVVVQ